ncbi:unnamed protein product, partial [Didymodactylos carnosus]
KYLYTKCNEEWNCNDGQDELNCTTSLTHYSNIQKGFGCNENEHYCIKFVDDGNNINMTCLPLNKAADGITDCIRSTDERKINNCSIWYPQELDKRFHCMNSDICTDPSQVCDRTFDCPYGDDERVCPWLIFCKFHIFSMPRSAIYRYALFAL